MNGKQLKNSILQWAIQGKLVPQDPNDEPASALLERIRAEKAKLVKEKKIKKDKNESIIYRGDDNSYYEKFLATGEVKCIDEEIPFEIPQGWEWCRMGNIIELLSGQDFLPEKYNSNNKGVPYITGASNINNGELVINRWTEYPSVIGKLGDLLIVCKGSGIGKMCFCNVKKIHIARQIQIIRVFSSFICFPYLKSVVDTNLSSVISNAQGVIPGISREHILNLIIPIPPFNTQQRIVEKLKLLQPLIQLFDNKQKELESIDLSIKELLKKSILQEAIQGKLVPQIAGEGTAQELLEQIQQEKQNLVKEGKLKKSALTNSFIYKGDDNKYYERIGLDNIDVTEEIPFDLPKNWSWIRFGQYVRISIGKTAPRGEAKYWMNGKYPWVSISDMSDYGFVKTTKETVSECTKSLFGEISPAGTLIMSFKLTVGRTSLLNISAYHNEAIISIYPFIDKDYQARNYLFYILPVISNLGDSRDAIKGKTLNSRSLNKLLLPLPPLEEQGRIVTMIKQLFYKLN